MAICAGQNIIFPMKETLDNTAWFLQFRIGNARVINGFQSLNEHQLGGTDVAESDWAIGEVACLYLAIDKAVHQSGDAFLSVFGQRARSSLYRVGHHQNGLLACEGIRTRIGEEFFVHLLFGMLVFI